MPVATSHRKEPTEMNVISKAKDVFKHSRLMIKNDNRFPKMDELYNQLFKEVKENVSTSIEPADRGKSEVR